MLRREFIVGRTSNEKGVRYVQFLRLVVGLHYTSSFFLFNLIHRDYRHLRIGLQDALPFPFGCPVALRWVDFVEGWGRGRH